MLLFSWPNSLSIIQWSYIKRTDLQWSAHFDSDWNILTAIRWIAIEFCTDIYCHQWLKPTEFVNPLSFHLEPPCGWFVDWNVSKTVVRADLVQTCTSQISSKVTTSTSSGQDFSIILIKITWRKISKLIAVPQYSLTDGAFPYWIGLTRFNSAHQPSVALIWISTTTELASWKCVDVLVLSRGQWSSSLQHYWRITTNKVQLIWC